MADEGHAQQPPEVTPANAPAVVQPIQPLADEVADEGHAQQPLEVTPASAPAAVQPIQRWVDAGGTETVAETPQPLAGLGIMVPIGRWGVQRCAHWFSDDQICLAAAKHVYEHGIDGQMLEDMTSSDLIELGVSAERAHDVYQAIHKLSKKTVTWAAQVEQEEEEELASQRAERQREAAQESAQPLAGEELVAGVDYNDESHDVEVGSDRDLSDGERDIHGSEVEDVAFMREVRAVRRMYASYHLREIVVM